jgi:hypothetical protein
LYNVANDSPWIQAAENRQKRILNADYTAVDIDDYIASLLHLNAVEKQQLVTLLKSHNKLFGGSLGTLSITPCPMPSVTAIGASKSKLFGFVIVVSKRFLHF